MPDPLAAITFSGAEHALGGRGGVLGIAGKINHHQLDLDAPQRLDATGGVDVVHGKLRPVQVLYPGVSVAARQAVQEGDSDFFFSATLATDQREPKEGE